MNAFIQLQRVSQCLRPTIALLLVWPVSASLAELAATHTSLQATQATSQPASTPPRCALIVAPAMGLDRSPLVGLLEVKLAEQKHVTLLERTEIDRVLREQQLQLLFSPEGGGQREAVGRLLKADLLVLLRSVEQKGKGRSIGVVACETKAGLRLRVEHVVPSDNPEENAAMLTALVEQAAAKWAAPARHIVAVPPFTGSDFLHKYDYLQRLLARTIERWFISQEGVVAVELAEAEAIAHELATSGSRASVERQLPYYVLGEYQVAKRGNDDLFAVTLTLRQGERLIDKANREGIPVDQILGFVIEGTGRLAKNVVQPPSMHPDPNAEVRQLLERADAFIGSRDYTESLDLIEATVLLRPDDPDLHAKAIAVTCNLIRDLCRRKSEFYIPEVQDGAPVDDFVARSMLVMHYQQLGVNHTERWLNLVDLRRISEKEAETASAVAGNCWSCYRERITVPLEREFYDRFQTSLKDYGDRVLRILERKATEGTVGAHVLSTFLGMGEALRLGEDYKLPVIRAIQNVPGAEFPIVKSVVFIPLDHPERGEPIRMDDGLACSLLDQKKLRLIQEIDKLPGRAARRASQILADLRRSADEWLEAKEEKTLLKEMAAFERARSEATVHYRIGAEKVGVKRIKKGQLPSQWPPSEQWPTPPTEITYQRVDMTVDHSDTRLNSWLLGWLACAPGLDVTWTADEVLLMKEKGHLQSLCRLRESAFLGEEYTPRPAQGTWDGRYVWLPARYAKEPYILLVDPRTEKVRRLTTQDGLPPMSSDLEVTAVTPGKAVVAAAFGRPGGGTLQIDRSWCAVVSIDDQGRVSHHTLVEASKPYEYGGRMSRDDPGIVFRPVGMLTVGGSEAHPGRLVALLRSIGGEAARRGGGVPLIIDPETGRVQTTPMGFGGHTNGPHWFSYQSSIYYLADATFLAFKYLGPPDYKPNSCSRLGVERPVKRGVITSHLGKIGALFADQEYLYILADSCDWGIARLGDHSIFWVAADSPAEPWNLPRVCRSHHYGLIVLVGDVYQVNISAAAYQRADQLAADEDAEDAEADKATRENRARMAQMKNQPVADDLPPEPVSPFTWIEVVAVSGLVAFLVYRLKRRAS